MKNKIITFLITILSSSTLFSCGANTSNNSHLQYRITDEENKYVEVSSIEDVGDGHVIIPENVTINKTNYTVTGIGDRAFSDTDILSVEIPKSIKYIGIDSFVHCIYLNMVNIYEGLTNIGKGAFYLCESLKRIKIPDTLETIGDEAFACCANLENIYLPNGLKSIGDHSFYECSSLTSIDFPNSLTKIGIETFLFCNKITTIKIPKSVNFIGSSAFAHMSLENISVSSENETFDSRNYCNAIINSLSNELIAGCINTKIPNNITSIGVSAFSGINGLKTIHIPNSVQSIGNFAFSFCSNLENIIIPNSVTKIGEWAFEECNSLTFKCEALYKPDGWNDYWNPGNRPVVWGYKAN